MKNWTVKEAAKVIRENKDAEAVKEIVKHFPLFAVIVAGKDFDGLTDAMPEHMTVRKIENELNNGSTGDADVEDDEDQAEDDTTAEDLENMSTKQLIALCGKRGIKVPKYGKNKQFYLDALNSAGDEDEDADTEETEEEEDPVALYKKCKKAGLKVAPKKSAKYYKDQLAKAAAEEDDTDDEDDWDDEEEEEKPAKKAPKKAPAKKGAKKPAKKSEPEEDDDDDEDDEDEDEWDI
jgi:hypothetical protein